MPAPAPQRPKFLRPRHRPLTTWPAENRSWMFSHGPASSCFTLRLELALLVGQILSTITCSDWPGCTSFIKEGQEVEVKILNIDPAQQRISLSLRQAMADEPVKTTEEGRRKRRRSGAAARRRRPICVAASGPGLVLAATAE